MSSQFLPSKARLVLRKTWTPKNMLRVATCPDDTQLVLKRIEIFAAADLGLKLMNPGLETRAGQTTRQIWGEHQI
jgi:hypothetical protein